MADDVNNTHSSPREAKKFWKAKGTGCAVALPTFWPEVS